jgi:hypothetical protein
LVLKTPVENAPRTSIEKHLSWSLDIPNGNMKALGVLESKWDPIRKKLVRRLLEEQDKVLRFYFAHKGGTRSKGGDKGNCKGREHVQGTCMREDGAGGPWPSDQIWIQ